MLPIAHWSCIFPNERMNVNNPDKFKRVRLLNVGLPDVFDRVGAFLPPVCLRISSTFSLVITVDRFVQPRQVFPLIVFRHLHRLVYETVYL
jgi:hypothetical protein